MGCLYQSSPLRDQGTRWKRRQKECKARGGRSHQEIKAPEINRMNALMNSQRFRQLKQGLHSWGPRAKRTSGHMTHPEPKSNLRLLTTCKWKFSSLQGSLTRETNCSEGWAVCPSVDGQQKWILKHFQRFPVLQCHGRLFPFEILISFLYFSHTFLLFFPSRFSITHYNLQVSDLAWFLSVWMSGSLFCAYSCALSPQFACSILFWMW